MALDDADQVIKDKIEIVWESTVTYCLRVLHHAGVYGFGLMHLPNPNVEQIHKSLKFGVLPMLNKLSDDPNLEPDDGMKVDNIRQYINHLTKIVDAIEQGDAVAFDAAVAALGKEAMM